jgi:hypothetical protein
MARSKALKSGLMLEVKNQTGKECSLNPVGHSGNPEFCPLACKAEVVNRGFTGGPHRLDFEARCCRLCPAQ